MALGRVDEDVDLVLVPEMGEQFDAVAGDAGADRGQGREPGDSLHAHSRAAVSIPFVSPDHRPGTRTITAPD